MNKEGILNESYADRVVFENEYGFVSWDLYDVVRFEFDTKDYYISQTPYNGSDGIEAERVFDYYSSVLRWCKRHNYKSKVKPDEKWDTSESKEYKNNSGTAFLVSHNFLYEVGVIVNGESGSCAYWGHDYAAAKKKFNKCKAVLQRHKRKNNMRTR